MRFKTLLPTIALLLNFACIGLSSPAQAKAIEGVVNINTASVSELTLLPGVGKAKAEQILQLRQAKPFSSVEDLKGIKGLGEKRLEAMRPHVVVNGATTAKKIATPKAGAPTANAASSPKI